MGRFYYGWIVVGITGLTVLVAAGVRSAPGVFIYPLEVEFGWSRAAIALAVSIGLIIYGLAGPASGRLINQFGMRAVMMAGLTLISLSMLIATAVQEVWHLNLLWGLLSGAGTGVTASVLSATVAVRWFVARRGLVLGILGAAISAGQLIFIPLLMWLVVTTGWRGGSIALAAVALLLLAPVFLLMKNDPSDAGLTPYGSSAPTPASVASDVTPVGGVMRQAIRVPEFWLLAGSFWVCGATSTGLIGTHLIPHSIDHGIPEITAASAVALMGAMNFVGTIASGWLTDRYDKRTLLAIYYSLRGLSLFLLPFVGDFAGLAIFAIVFGLDYIATVPPTAALAADIFGRKHVAVVFGWVFFAHQMGAAMAAWLGGVARVALGDYQLTFLAAGVVAIIGGLMALRINTNQIPEPASLKV